MDKAASVLNKGLDITQSLVGGLGKKRGAESWPYPQYPHSTHGATQLYHPQGPQMGGGSQASYW